MGRNAEVQRMIRNRNSAMLKRNQEWAFMQQQSAAVEVIEIEDYMFKSAESMENSTEFPPHATVIDPNGVFRMTW